LFLYINLFLDMPTEKLTAFIKEICLEYSELLYFSFKFTHEIREIELVKNCLNERFKKLNKICFQLEGELNEYKSNNTILSGSNTAIKSEKFEELKFKITNKENEMNILKLNLEVIFVIFNNFR